MLHILKTSLTYDMSLETVQGEVTAAAATTLLIVKNKDNQTFSIDITSHYEKIRKAHLTFTSVF